MGRNRMENKDGNTAEGMICRKDSEFGKTKMQQIREDAINMIKNNEEFLLVFRCKDGMQTMSTVSIPHTAIRINEEIESWNVQLIKSFMDTLKLGMGDINEKDN